MSLRTFMLCSTLAVASLSACGGNPEPGCTMYCATGGGMAGGIGGNAGGSGGSGGSGGGTTTGQFTVSGGVTYDFVPATADGLQFSQAMPRPARNVAVQVIQGMKVVGEGVTTDDGAYQIGFTPQGSDPLLLIAFTRTLSPQIRVQDNTDGKSLWGVGAQLTAATQTVNLHAAHGWAGTGYDSAKRTAAPFAVLDSMYTAARAFMAVRPAVQFPPLTVNWSPNNVPQAGDKAMGLISTSHFARDVGELFILGKEGVDTDEFDSHVIVHEWGHFFEFNLSRSDSPGGRHGPGDVLDPRIAFGEAWGNAVASMVLPETVYVDTSWGMSGLSGFGFDAENEPTPTDDPTPSGFSESSVLRALFNLYDPANESFDPVALGLGPIYDAMVGAEKTTDSVTTLASFVTALKALPQADGARIDQLLAHYQIGAITSQWGDGDPGLAGMFTLAEQLPYSGNIGLGGGNLANTWQQNQYYVFTGTGGPVTVTASSAYDVMLTAYRAGEIVARVDMTQSGTETATLMTQSGAKYVVVLTGFGAVQGDYDVSVSIQ